jgi:excisionase family DNA binding protein
MKIELHSAEEVADTLGVELDTLYRYARKGTIHGLKVGKAWRFLDVDVQEFLQKQRYNSHSPEAGATFAESHSHNGAGHHTVEASYAEVDAASNLLAASLLKHGLTPSGRVLVLLSNSLEFVVGCFAVWKAGAILVTESPSIKDETLHYIIHECNPQALILDRDVAERLEGVRYGLEHVRVVYVKNRASSLSGLAPLQVESLDAVLENKTSSKVLRFTPPAPEKIASLTYAAGPNGVSKGAVNAQHP